MEKTYKELKDLGVTQSMIAKEMRTTRQNVNFWFTGKREASAGTVKRLAEAMTALTGKKVYPAQVYNIISSIRDSREHVGGAK